MQDYIEIDAVPFGEEEIFNKPYNSEIKNKEAIAYKNQLLRMFPPTNKDCGIEIVNNVTENFNYLTLKLWYIVDGKSEEWAFFVESNLPEFWDNKAKEELGLVENKESERFDGLS